MPRKNLTPEQRKQAYEKLGKKALSLIIDYELETGIKIFDDLTGNEKIAMDNKRYERKRYLKKINRLPKSTILQLWKKYTWDT